MKMTIAKALKHKNRVASRLSSISSDVQSHNSELVDAEKEVNIDALVSARKTLQNHLIELKTKIFNSTSPIREQIIEKGELGSEITFYRNLKTTHGMVAADVYNRSQEPLQYAAVIRKAEVDSAILKLESRIEEIQDNLDEFNVKNTIEIEIPKVFASPIT